MRIFTEKLREVLQSVLPITLLVVLLHFTLTPLETIDLQRFLFGAFLIIIGLSIFLFGVDLGITPIGKFLGRGLARSNSMKYVLGMGIVLGFFISIAEPDLHILATQVSEVTNGMYPKNSALARRFRRHRCDADDRPVSDRLPLSVEQGFHVPLPCHLRLGLLQFE